MLQIAVFIAASMAELSDDATVESETSLKFSYASISKDDMAVLEVQPYSVQPFAKHYELAQDSNEEVNQYLNQRYF